jgi:hypothetical protein
VGSDWSEYGNAYHDQKAIKKPIHEKKKTRPYWLTGLKTGMDLAFLLYGLSSGAAQSLLIVKPILETLGKVCCSRIARRQGYFADLEIEERQLATCT